jgi:cyclohexadieny/prephenate dehydrogenase
VTEPAPQAPLFERATLVGLGLIGSSLGWAMKRGGVAREIVGWDRDAAVRATALRLGFVDAAPDEAAEAARGADLVALCVPVGAMGAVAEAVAPGLSPGAIVTDVGSVKAAVVRAVLPHLPEGAAFVPAHPLAGTEHSGPEAGFATLFDGRWCIVTPAPGAPRRAVEKVREVWERCGANVDEMTPERHDLVLAVTSHTPHLIAYTMVGVADDMRRVTKSEVIKYSAAGFRDFTRIAASDPTMWRDVFLTNRDAVLEVLGRVSEDLAALQRAIRWGEGDTLFQRF